MRSAPIARVLAQRPFLLAVLLGLLLMPGARANGEACADDGFALSAFGFLFSRLPFCSRFATASLLCG